MVYDTWYTHAHVRTQCAHTHIRTRPNTRIDTQNETIYTLNISFYHTYIRMHPHKHCEYMNDNCRQLKSITKQVYILKRHYITLPLKAALTRTKNIFLLNIDLHMYLQTILGVEEIKLDWMFKISLVTDLANVSV